MLILSQIQSKQVNLEERLKILSSDDRFSHLASPFPENEMRVYRAFIRAFKNRLNRINSQKSNTNFSDAVSIYEVLRKKYSQMFPDLSDADLAAKIKISHEYKDAEEKFNLEKQAETEAHTKRFGHDLAYIIVIGYDPKIHKKYTGEGVFHNGKVHLEGKVVERTCIGKNMLADEIGDEFYQIGKQDRAVLSDGGLVILGTNVHLEHEDDKNEGEDYRIETEDVNRRYGILAGGAERQKNSRLASKYLSGAVVYSVGETGIIRRFMAGHQTFSTDDEEDLWILGSLGLRTTED